MPPTFKIYLERETTEGREGLAVCSVVDPGHCSSVLFSVQRDEKFQNHVFVEEIM